LSLSRRRPSRDILKQFVQRLARGATTPGFDMLEDFTMFGLKREIAHVRRAKVSFDVMSLHVVSLQ
jgi:hypothetical protein